MPRLRKRVILRLSYKRKSAKVEVGQPKCVRRRRAHTNLFVAHGLRVDVIPVCAVFCTPALQNASTSYDRGALVTSGDCKVLLTSMSDGCFLKLSESLS